MEEVQCLQCNTVPDNYVRLDCDHKFCLICLAYNYLQLQQHQAESENLTICSICKLETYLDSETIQALRFVIQEIILPMIEEQGRTEQVEQVETIEEEVELESDQVDTLQNQHESNNSVVKDQSLKQSYVRQSLLQDSMVNESIVKESLFKDNFFKESNPTDFQKQSDLKKSSSKGEQLPKQSFVKESMTESMKQQSQSRAQLDFYEQRQSKDGFQDNLKQLRKERIESYQERLEKNLKSKVELVREIQDQRLQFQRRCETLRENVNDQFKQVNITLQQFIQTVELKSNQLLNEIQSVEMLQLLEIQKQEQEYEQSLQIMAKQQDELSKLKFINISQEDLNKTLIEIEKLLSNTSMNLQIKSQISNAQRNLARIQTQAQSYLIQPLENQNQQQSIQMTQNRETTRFERDSFAKSSIPTKLSPKQEKIQDLWYKIDSGNKQLQDSQITYTNSNTKSKWKEAIFDIFDKKIEEGLQNERNNQKAQKQPYNIHDILNMQQQCFMQQKDILFRR